MKNLIAAVIASIPGMLAGVVLWTIVAVCLLVVYWFGYEMLFLGLACGTGKWGLGWCSPPSPSIQTATREWTTLLTVFAFTFGEIFAGLLGGFFGGALGVVGMRFLTFLRRIGRRKRDGEQKQGESAEQVPAMDGPHPCVGRNVLGDSTKAK